MLAFVLALAGGSLSAPSGAPGAAGALPSGFSETVVFTSLTQPTAVRFSPDGRVFVAEKSGLIKVFDGLTDTTPTVFADLSTNVYNFWDRGLLGLALDPGFPSRPYVYVLYAHDAAIGGTAPRWGTPGILSDPCPNPPGATANGCVVSGRLSRLEAAGSVMTGTERVLLEGWCQQYPSHSLGSLAFGADGALYVSGGDGASFTQADYGQFGTPRNPCGDPPGGVGATLSPPTAEGGALRSQDLRTNTDPVGLNGTVLRVDPSTGDALPDNPLAFDPDVNARRIVAYGLRNPFRLAVKPGTNELWVGDVGWDVAEEIDIVRPNVLENFGWPCYEGTGRQSAYDGLNLDLCESLYAAPGAVRQPHFAYPHDAPAFSGDTCSPSGGSSVSGLAFYGGGSYPARYNGALFFADYSRKCIWALIGGSATAPETFASVGAGPVDLQAGPGGDLFYADLDGGTVVRIRYDAAPGDGSAYVSDMPWVSSSNGHGPVERDRSNGEGAGGDGAVLTLNGATFAKGLGVHAPSEVAASLAGCSRFRATLGVDDEVGPRGSVRFQVFGDGVMLWQSAVLSGASASVAVDVDVSNRSTLRLVVTEAGDGGAYDHADWAEARVVCGPGDTTPPAVVSVSPPAGAAGVAASVRPSATFSEPMAAASVSASTFVLRKQGASSDVPASVAYDAASRTATLTPAAALDAGGSYTARVVGGPAGVKDAAANPLPADHTWSFTVAASTNTPPTPTISAPAAGTTWAVGDSISFAGSAADSQDGTLGPARLSWSLVLAHCPSGCHTHPIQDFNGVASGSFTAPDHEYPSHLELRLTATDSGGLTGTATRRLDPRTVQLTMQSVPTGLQLSFGSGVATTPFTRTVIVGSQNAVNAPSPQTVGSQEYTYSTWSDGGAQSHAITAPSTNASYTATFTGSPSSTTTVFVSDLTWVSSSNGFGPVERDRSNGEEAGGDGGTLTLNGTAFAKGLGAHSLSEVVVSSGSSCSRLRATVGVDDEVGVNGSVSFQVFGDGVKLFESGVLTGASASVPVDVDVTGRSVLRLVVTEGGDGAGYDHADWAEARLVCAATTSIRVFPSSVVRQTGTAAGGNAQSLAADDGNYYSVNSTTFGTRTATWYGVLAGVPNSLQSLSVTYKGLNSVTCSQTVSIWRWTTSTWVTLATRSVGATEFLHSGLVPTGALADYVSGTTGNGDVRVRINCTASQSFVSRGDLLYVDYRP